MADYTHANITDVFNFHKPSDGQVISAHTNARHVMEDAAHWVLSNAPDCNERNIAIDKLREAMMWTNAAIACHWGKS